MTVTPGEGERRAQRGLVPQYKVAAEKIYALLLDGRLHGIGIADPEAATLDDIQVIRRHGGQLVLDAYQVKWSAPGETFGAGEFANLLAELVRARQAVIAAAKQRAQEGDAPVARVTAHLYTSRVASTAAIRAGSMRGTGCSLHGFLDRVWVPAQRGLIRALADVDAVWHPYVEQLAEPCGIAPDDLLALAPDLRIESGRELEEDALGESADWQTRDRLEDLVAIRAKLQDLVTARDATHIWLSADDFVGHLGPEWGARWRPRQEHVFPTPGPYEPLTRTAEDLSAALDRYDHGYVALTGSPGSGKSTLLTRLLRVDDRLAARYYAYVPDNDSITRGEASAFLHDLYLAIGGRRGGGGLAPRGSNLDRLREAFREELQLLGERARRSGRTEILLVDGLDHVERDPAPQHSLLRELPLPEEIPDGVLFVIGTRSLKDLPAQVVRAVRDGRHVEIEPLQRAAVIRLCEKEGLPELGERIFELSAGHPLLAQTYLSFAAGLDPQQRAEALAELPPSGGRVWSLYDSVWEGLRDDPDLVALLGAVSRLRGTIRLSWLARTGRPGEVERLAQIDWLFDRGGDRWRFFHSSFREFLRRRTAELDDEFNEQLHRGHHEALAGRCQHSGSDDPERFDRLFHLLEAGMPEAVLAEATPAFFREQLDGLRPREAVRGDIALAARALADRHDPLGVVRLALTANELQLRSYNYPEGAAFLNLLVAVGQPELAIAYVAGIDNMTAGNDRVATAMELAVTLHDVELAAEAGRLLELYEPLEWFGARPSGRSNPLRGPRDLLTGWARAAAVVRGGGYVLAASEALRSPAGLDERERYDEEDLAHLRASLLWAAATELFRRERFDEVSSLRAELANLGEPGRDACVLLDLYLARSSASDAAEERRLLRTLDTDDLPYWGKIELIERLLHLGDEASARPLFAALPEPSLPVRDYTRLTAEEPPWDEYYRYWRLTARLGQAPDPVHAVPAAKKDYLEQVVLTARHVVGFAVIDGRRQAGQSISAAEIVAALRRMHSFWATKWGRDDDRRPGAARALVSSRAIAVAKELGPSAVQQVFAYFRTRWDERRANLWQDGTALIGKFAAAGIGEVSVRGVLADLETLHGQGESSPEDWISLGQAWARADDLEAAARCCRRAVHSTLALTSEKELQLGTLTRLLVPLLDGPQGDHLASEFGAALTALSQHSFGGAPDHAARILLELTVPSHPLRAWDLASGFLENRVLGPNEVIEAFLVATADRPGIHWWTVVSELLVAIGVDAPSKALQTAVHADRGAAQRWLPFLLERVAVEGRPSARRGWRSVARSAAGEAGLSHEVAIDEEELEVGDETPPRNSSEASTTPPGAAPSLEEQLQRLEVRDPNDYLRSEPSRILIRHLDELDDAQVERLERCLAGTDDEPRLRAALAARAAVGGDVDRAWEEGSRAVAVSRAGDWSRHWAGGPMLKLIPELRALDRNRAVALMFSRFAELAASEDYFLGQVGSELADYAAVFEPPPEETAREVLGVAAALLRDVATLPEPASLSAGRVELAADDELARAFERIVGWFFGSPHIVAWQAGQRAVLTLLANDAGFEVLQEALRCGEQEVVRACAVIEAAAAEGHDVDQLVPALERISGSESLTERAAAIGCLQALSQPFPAAARPARAHLPPGLRLELPPRGHKQSLATGVAQMVGWHRSEIEALAEAAKVDEDALFERVLIRAEQLAGEKDAGDGQMSREGGMLGWGFIKPSAVAVRHAVAEAAATLVDARRVAPMTALSAARLSPVYDPVLLRMRPARRPHEVPTFVPHDRRSRLYQVSLEELAADAEARLARTHEDWIVIGERSEISLLDSYGHAEQRWSGVLLDDAHDLTQPLGEADDGGELLHDLRRASAASYPDFAKLPIEPQAIVGAPDIPPIVSPSSWLAIHPRIALELGLAPDPEDPFTWQLEAEPAVRSVWWRSGYTKWQPWSDGDEVGEGWLVVASPAVIERWQQRQRLQQGWAVFTSRRGDSDSTPPGQVRASGLWAL